MSDIVEVVEEEFDDEGNLVRRTTTKYGSNTSTTPWSPGIRVGDTWPYGTGQIVTNPEKYTVWNDSNTYDYGTYARRAQGGTDRDGKGVVV